MNINTCSNFKLSKTLTGTDLYFLLTHVTNDGQSLTFLPYRSISYTTDEYFLKFLEPLRKITL